MSAKAMTVAPNSPQIERDTIYLEGGGGWGEVLYLEVKCCFAGATVLRARIHACPRRVSAYQDCHTHCASMPTLQRHVTKKQQTRCQSTGKDLPNQHRLHCRRPVYYCIPLIAICFLALECAVRTSGTFWVAKAEMCRRDPG